MSHSQRHDIRLIIYPAVLAGLILLYVVGSVIAPRPGAAARRPLLPGLGQRQIMRIVIEEPPGGTSRELVFTDEQWWVSIDGTHYPAREERVQAFLNELADGRTLRDVSENADLHADFGVDDRSATAVSLYAFSGESAPSATIGDSGAAVAELLWGNAAPSGGRYVRFAEADTVLESDADVSFYLTQPTPYWSYLRVLPESVVADSVVEVTVELVGESEQNYSLRKERTDDGDQWTLADGVARELDTAAVDRLVRSIADLVGRDFYRGDAPLDQTSRAGTIKITTGNGAGFTIEVHLLGELAVAVPIGNGTRLSPIGRPYPVEIAQTTVTQLTPALETLVAGE